MTLDEDLAIAVVFNIAKQNTTTFSTNVELHVRSSACDLMLNMSQRVTLPLSSTHNHHINDAANSHHQRCPTSNPSPYHGKQPRPHNNDSTTTANAHERTQGMMTTMSDDTHHPRTITHNPPTPTSHDKCTLQLPANHDCPPRSETGPTTHKDDNRPPSRHRG